MIAKIKKNEILKILLKESTTTNDKLIKPSISMETYVRKAVIKEITRKPRKPT